MIFLTLCSIWAIISHVPVLLTAYVAQSLGVVVEGVTLGFGPMLLTRKNWILRAIPMNSSVRFKVTDSMPLLTAHEKKGALDVQPAWVQLLVSVSIPACLLAIACVLLGVDALRYFAGGFAQLVSGALEPFSSAQTYLASYHAALADQSFGFVLGLTAAKMAAFHLLPFSSVGGFQLVLTVVQAFSARTLTFPRTERLVLWLTLLLVASWALAVVIYVMAPP
ncbi:hypothetical protein RBA41_00760 [Massilia sp. CCM 9210]|uniref:hypothetical protein n=1 Tax=Massilia scottii TaxID=3057166 RepID=UPI0027966A60|nr:hypothetical protein [Massilia sp. CCM 9210]MDQ1811824.1 hypothetical protein [Massilia sp. CCM 9210]